MPHLTVAEDASHGMRRDADPTGEAPCRRSARGLMVVTAFLWSTPFLWTLVASFRPEMAGGDRHGVAGAGLRADARQLRARLRERRLRGLLPQHRDRGVRHPGGAGRDDLAGGLRLRPPRFPRPRRDLLRLPAAAHAGAADPDRAQPAHGRRSRPLRQPARRDGALLRLGLRHLPDAPDLPPDPARLRGGRHDRRRAVVADAVARAAADGQARPDRLLAGLADGALERVPVAADGAQRSQHPHPDHRPGELRAQHRGRRANGACSRPAPCW